MWRRERPIPFTRPKKETLRRKINVIMELID
jgi:hypothetical protein